MKYITVLGSLNMDISVSTDKMPSIGETVFGHDFKMSPGGKGLNQAVAASRLGAEVTFAGCTGNDFFGDQLIDCLQHEGIDTRLISRLDQAQTGTAVIYVSDSNNCIVVNSGANSVVKFSDGIRDAIENSSVILAQFETPVEIVTEAFSYARQHGVTTILNPAPAHDINEELLSLTDILIPNEVEFEQIAGVKFESADDIAGAITIVRSCGVKDVIITLGDKGIVYSCGKELFQIPAYSVHCVDTTSAGDTFCGALASCLSSGRSIHDAAEFAVAASALAVTKRGAAQSIPTKAETESFIKNFGISKHCPINTGGKNVLPTFY